MPAASVAPVSLPGAVRERHHPDPGSRSKGHLRVKAGMSALVPDHDVLVSFGAKEPQAHARNAGVRLPVGIEHHRQGARL